MAGIWTVKGVERMFNAFFRTSGSLPTNFFVVLVTSDDVPTQDTENLSELTEIATGNGYTSGGYVLDPNTTDFDTITALPGTFLVSMKIKDVVWTASGGTIPSSGNPARYAVLVDDGGDPVVISFWDLGTSVSVSSGDTITLEDLELRGTV